MMSRQPPIQFCTYSLLRYDFVCIINLGPGSFSCEPLKKQTMKLALTIALVNQNSQDLSQN